MVSMDASGDYQIMPEIKLMMMMMMITHA